VTKGKKRFAGVDERGKPVFKSIELSAWECPACGVGVRGDVEVCPNCVKNKTEFATKEDLVGRSRIISELRPKGFAPTEKPDTRSGGHG
jgi:hypothetical protein